MKTTLSREVGKDFTPVFILKDEDKIERHPFFKLQSEADQIYLSSFQKKFPVRKDHTHELVLPSGAKTIILGVGEKQNFNHRKAILNIRRAVQVARKEKIEKITVNAEDFAAKDTRKDKKTLVEIIAVQLEIANFEFTKYKTPPPEGHFFVAEAQIFLSKINAGLKIAVVQGKIVGEEINNSRTLANTPGGDMTPALLAKEAEKVAEKISGVKTSILDEPEIKKLKMGGILGVARGSSERPKFIILEYLRGRKKEKPVVLVGKGVTFDTGGLNLKPTDGIYEMHMDMSGGAAVIHSIAALARLKVRKNIIGLIPAVENMPSGSSYRPGDVLTTMSGKTIEVLNTDAEGRIILADALEYAKRCEPRLIIDVATLTGAAITALGQRASAIFSNDARIEQKLIMSGEQTGDYAWALPLWEEYEDDIKGTFGDVANSNKNKTGGGAITAAVFLWQFIKNTDPNSKQEKPVPWAHIDIAPRMTSIEGEYLAKGSAGAPIALVTNFLKKF